MSLLILPSELIYHVFDYCDAQTILLSVRPVCKRLNEIVKTYNRFNLDFNVKYSDYMKRIIHIIQPENVTSLNFWNNYCQSAPINVLILSNINQFTRLRSLTLCRITEKEVKYILHHIDKTHFTSLSIQTNQKEDEKMWNLVSSALRQCSLQKLSMNNIDYKRQYIQWPDQWKLVYLAIQDCTYSEYLNILRDLPNLQTLVMRRCIFENVYNNSSLLSTSPSHSLLASMTITNYLISLNEFALMLLKTPSLKHLKLISLRKTFDYIFDGSVWRDFIINKLPLLVRFEFFFSYQYDKNQQYSSLESIMIPFRTPFYLQDKHSFVTCTYVPKSHAIWLYTTPLCVDDDGECPIRCEISWNDEICRLTQRPMNEINDTTTHTTSLTTADFGGFGIGDQGIRHFAEALRHNTTMTSLDLLGNDVQDEGVEYLAAVLQHNNTITTVNLLRNKIGDRGARYLADVLRNNQTLISLNLIHNKITSNGAEHLANVLKYNRTLTTLHLWNNEIEDKGAQYFSTTLQYNTTLEILDLCGNKIGYEGALKLVDVLPYNTTLKQLWLRDNNISSDVKPLLREQDSRIQC